MKPPPLCRPNLRKPYFASKPYFTTGLTARVAIDVAQ